MILLETNKTKLTDLPLTCVNLNGFEIPDFSERVLYEDLIINDITSELPYWYSATPHVLFKTKADFADVTDVRIDTIAGNTLWSYPSAIPSVTIGDWTYYYLPIASLDDSSYNDKRLLLIVVADGVDIMVAPIRQMNFEDTLNSCLVFNYWNKGGDVLGLQFDGFEPLHGLVYTVKGGILTGGTKATIDTETFRDQRFKLHTLSAQSGKTAVLTIGGNEGVPEYVADYVNNILCCDTVYLNGKRIIRSGNSIPEVKTIAAGYPFVTISVEVEYVATEIDDYIITI